MSIHNQALHFTGISWIATPIRSDNEVRRLTGFLNRFDSVSCCPRDVWHKKLIEKPQGIASTGFVSIGSNLGEVRRLGRTVKANPYQQQ